MEGTSTQPHEARAAYLRQSGNVLVGQPIGENFISGGENIVADIFDIIPAEVIEPDFMRYESFNIKGIDFKGRPRKNDTELKYIFNFLENHLHKGDRFLIKMESVLYSCSSCQRYLQALQNYAKSQGKIIEVQFLTHPQADRVDDVFRLIN